MPPSPDDRLHPVARAFDGAAGAYERARPEYPRAAMDRLRDALGLTDGSVVVDLAAGTGKLTRSLRGSVRPRILAVEPSAGMRAEFRRAVPDVPVVDGTAERIPLRTGAADAVVVGQAFHWFDPAVAGPEIGRVVRIGGGLAAVWNHRDERVPWVARLGAILHPPERDAAPSAREHGWHVGTRLPGPFGPMELATFSFEQLLPPDGVVDRALSVSYVAGLPEARRRVIADEVRRLLRDDPSLVVDGAVRLPYVTELFWTHRLSELR